MTLDSLHETAGEDTDDRWSRVEQLWIGARQQPKDERSRWLEITCAGDSELEREVRELLGAAEKTGEPLRALVGDAWASLLESESDSFVSDLYSTALGALEGGWRERDLTGESLGYLRLEEVLGRGGMGSVYRGVDTRLGRQVAFKVLNWEAASNPGLARRLSREARLLSQLDHSGICRLYDVLITPELTGLVLELVPGSPLSREISGPIDPSQALHMGLELAEALTAVHDAGVVHRDIKPSNVMMMESGRLKLLDFGIARLEETRAQGTGGGFGLSTEPAFEAPAPTRPGEVLGTLHYMSPEQFRGETVSSASDVFALGLVLYELLSGEPAYARERHGTRQLDAIYRARVPKLSGLDKGITDLIAGMTSLAPSARPTARDVGQRLRALLEAPARRLRRRLLGALAVTATLVALTMTWLYHRVGEEAARARSALERAQQEEERARQKTETVRQLSVVLTGFLDIADPWGPDSDESREAVRELFAQSWRELLPELSHDKEARAALLMKVADLAESLRLHAVVIEASEEAAALFEELQGPDDLKLAEALGYMAFGHGLAGRSDLSVEQLRRALEIIERHEQEVDPELYNGTLVRLVDALPDVGAYDECEALSRRHLAVSKELFGEGSMEQLEAQFLMGGLLSEKAWREGKPSLFDESERYLRAALQSVETLFGEEHVSFSMALAELGKLAFRRGRLALAGERYAKSHAIRVREFGEDSLIAAVSSVRIARVLSEQGRHLEAEARARQAVDWIEAEKDEQTYALAFPLFLHGKTLAQLKRFGEAEKQLLRAIAAAREVFSADHWETHRVEMELARVLAATGRVEEAEDLLISVLERNTGPDQGLIARAGNELLEEIRRSEAGAQNP